MRENFYSSAILTEVKWTIPGGGVNAGNHLKTLQFEKHRKRWNYVSKFNTHRNLCSQKEYKHDSLTIFYTKTQSPEFIIDPVEIEEARWMSFDEVPEPRGSAITRTFSLFNAWQHEQR